MTRPAEASGEALERRAGRRRIAIFGSVFAFGAVSGAYMAHAGEGKIGALIGPDPVMAPGVAIALAAGMLLAVAAGTLLLRGQLDEHRKAGLYKAASAAGNAYLLTYMSWFILWKGGVVPEPVHLLLFLLFIVAMGASSIYYRFR